MFYAFSSYIFSSKTSSLQDVILALSTLKTIFFTIPNPILNANSYQGLFVYFTF